MKLSPKAAPHIRDSASNKTVMGDMILSLFALYVMAAFYYGPRSWMLGALGVAVSCACDLFCVFLRGGTVNFRDFSPVVTGMIIPLLMPASISYSVVAVACIFAICVVKHPFGGLGHNLFNPAAAGVAFAMVCWPTAMFSYPAHFANLPIFGPIASGLSASNAYTLYVGGVPTTSFNNILLGLMPGPMGATNVLVIFACLLYLVARGTVRLVQPLCCLGTAALLALLFPRVDVGPLDSVFYEVMCTSLVFCTAFVFTDPVTTPKRTLAKGLYGAASGLVLMLFRWFGGYEETILFAVLMMNAVGPAFDALVERWAMGERRKHDEGKGDPQFVSVEEGPDGEDLDDDALKAPIR